MKKFFKYLGIAALYFLLYFGIQIIVSIVFSIVVSMQIVFRMMSQTEKMDTNLFIQQASDQILQYTMSIIIIGGIIFILALWLIFFVRKKKIFQGISLKKIQIKSIVPLLLFGISLNFVISGVVELIPFPKSWIDSYLERYNAAENGNVIIAIIATILIAPIVEEIIFRGLIFSRLKKGMPVIAAAIISSMVFGLMHGNLIWGGYAFVLGLLLVWVFERFKSLTANILVHFSFNLVGVLLGFVTEMSDTLSIMLMGASVVVLIVSIVWIRALKKDDYCVKVIKC